MKPASGELSGILAIEFKTITAMARIYCRAHHHGGHKQGSSRNSNSLCDDCLAFTAFAKFRLLKCPYGQDKPTCKHCVTHCYRKEMKDKARTIMVYSGPRMLLKHPYLAIRHLIHNRRALPPLPGKKKGGVPISR